MRRINVSTSLTLGLLGAFLLSGCLDITSTSKVNSNGSIVRTIAFTGDSTDVYAGKFPLQLDSSWSKNITRSKEKDKICTLTASRTFRDAEEMNKVLGGKFSWTLQYRFVFEKSFQWFFTIYRYRETNLPFSQYESIPLTDFLSKAEIDMLVQDTLGDRTKQLMSRGDSLAMESFIPRLQEWEWRNKFEPIFAAFLDGVKMLNYPSLTIGMAETLKDSLYRKSEKAIDKGKIDSLRIIFKTVLKNPLVDKAWQANTPAIEEVKRRFAFEHETNSHKYFTNVVMPGLITGSNASKIEGNVATWQDYKEHVHHLEYTMWVESRQVNWWAVIIALALVVTLMAVLIISVLRRRNRV
ncbi:MAG: hypothetical protein NTZ35_08720 [Ignavibacteriales bacterium]|nr:hypothetical protein [Ignavibacteriales bacterium]